MMATNRQSRSGFYIGVVCPGCGGALELQENFFVLVCSHCGSILRVVMPESPPAYVIQGKKEKHEIRYRVDRYLKERGLPLTQSDFSPEGIYYPYWKVDGLELRMRGKTLNRTQTHTAAEILTTQMRYTDMRQIGHMMDAYLTGNEDDVVPQQDDLSIKLCPYHANQIAGPELAGIPYSLGLRTEYIEMTPHTQENIDDRYKYMPVLKPWSEVLANLSGATIDPNVKYPDPTYSPYKMIFQATGSVVYFPYFICKSGHCRLIIDGLTGRVVYESAGGSEMDAGDRPDPHIRFGMLNVIFHRCPTCGADLPATQSRVYICHNCHAVISLEKDIRLDGRIFSSGDRQHRHDSLFPFWVFKLPGTSVSKVAKLSGMGRSPDRLAIPAFRIANFKVMQQLTQRITAAYPRFPKEPVDSFTDNLRPVDITLSEAVTLAEICLYCEEAADKPDLPMNSVKIHPVEVELFYAPFHAQSYFYVDSVLDAVAFAKNTVAH